MTGKIELITDDIKSIIKEWAEDRWGEVGEVVLVSDPEGVKAEIELKVYGTESKEQ